MASRPAPSVHRSSNQQTDVPQRQSTHSRRTTTSKPLNFQQAMHDFGVMFPEIDRDVIETVLRANNGVVQTTIDQLLELQESAIIEQAESTNFVGHTLPSYEASIGEGEEPPPAYSDIWEDVPAPTPEPIEFLQPAAAFGSNHSRISSRAELRNQFWGAPIIGKLPDDFLRICGSHSAGPMLSSYDSDKQSTFNTECNQRKNTDSVGSDVHKRRTFSSEDFMADDDVERFLEDEKLAIFLQNEEFLRELRRNREFVNSLEADHRQAMEASGTPMSPSPAISGGARPRTTSTQEDAQFKQKLRHMGKSTKKKFGKIAKKFSRSKTTASRPIQSSESRFNLLDDEEPGDDRNNRTQEDLYYVEEEDEQSTLQRELNFNTNHTHNIDRTENFNMQRARPRPSVKNNRQLPLPPGGQGAMARGAMGGNDEPIVFYSEDNEFSYKSDA